MIKIILRDVRVSKHISIRQLSRLSGVSCGHISEIETGKKMPTLDGVVRLALALGVRPAELYLIYKDTRYRDNER